MSVAILVQAISIARAIVALGGYGGCLAQLFVVPPRPLPSSPQGAVPGLTAPYPPPASPLSLCSSTKGRHVCKDLHYVSHNIFFQY